MKPRLALALSLCAAAACAHREPVERTTVSAVGNQDMTDDANAPDNQKMTYTRVNNEDALNNGSQAGDTNSQQLGTGANGGATAASADPTNAQRASSGASGCDLNVYFATDSAKLDERAKQQLSSIAECLKRHEANDALIVGSADPRGSQPYNEKLGQERARVVSEYLRQLGVSQDDIRIRSAGESQASNQPASWPADRNAQIRKQQ